MNEEERKAALNNARSSIRLALLMLEGIDNPDDNPHEIECALTGCMDAIGDISRRDKQPGLEDLVGYYYP